MIKLFRFISLGLLVFLVACSDQSDKNSTYVGYWDLDVGENDYRKIVAIKAKGSGQLVLDYNVLKESNP